LIFTKNLTSSKIGFRRAHTRASMKPRLKSQLWPRRLDNDVSWVADISAVFSFQSDIFDASVSANGKATQVFFNRTCWKLTCSVSHGVLNTL
jgi:hypothetical protein